MLKLVKSTTERARTRGQRFFRAFGIHCATHQIRVILISSVVITSLFYPALALYSASRIPSLRVLASFAHLRDESRSPLLGELADIWSPHDALRTREDAISRARCGVEDTLRIERVITPISAGSTPFIHQALQSFLQLEQDLTDALQLNSINCLRTREGRCFVISPLAFWNHDSQRLETDGTPLHTLMQSKDVTISGIPVSPDMVATSGASDSLHLGQSNFLVLTYFFPQPDCIDNTGHDAWINVVNQVIANYGTLSTPAGEPALVSLEYNLGTNRGLTALSIFTVAAYIASLLYVTWHIRNVGFLLHSRLGLVFTGMVELAASTITSLSVCALVGFKVTLVPWELLSLTITFIGAENMLSLVEAVGRTPVSLSVKQRIAEGLSLAGTSNTLKVVSYNSILGLIAVFSTGAIRQFCVFAIVVLVAHWFLAHTFFTTVLSIDIQRLELDDLLRQGSGASLAGGKATTSPDPTTSKGSQDWSKIPGLVKIRAYKNLNLLLLLATTALIYYTTYTTSIVPPTHTQPLTAEVGGMAASRTWDILNPQRDALLHLRIEPPSVLTALNTSGADHPIQSHSYSLLRFPMLCRVVKIVVVPIAATTTLVYALLLYLLKDAELLEAQKHAAPVEEAPKEDESLDAKVSFSTLPRAFPTDVELIAASKDGNVVASIGAQHELAIWRLKTGSCTSVDISYLLERIPSGSNGSPHVSAIAVNDSGNYVAVGTAIGITLVWSIQDHSLSYLRQLSSSKLVSPVIDLAFLSYLHQPPSTGGTAKNQLLAVYENGMIIKWPVASNVSPGQLSSSQPGNVVKASLLRLNEDRLLGAFHLDDGSMDIVDTSDVGNDQHTEECHIQAGNPHDSVTHIHACHVHIEGSQRLVIVAATEGGAVSIWDGHTEECITILEDRFRGISALCVSPVPQDLCRKCGQLPPESFLIAFSIDSTVQIYRMCLPSTHRHCSCMPIELRRRSSEDGFGRLSRRSSTSSLSTLRPRSRLPSVSDETPFPVSGHGVHSRRASEKDSRRTSEIFSIPPPTEELESPVHPIGPLQFFASQPQPTSWWKNVRLIRQPDGTCERGRWSIVEGKVIGIRRRHRSEAQSKDAAHLMKNTSHGLALATLERWELWMLDPSTRLYRSALAALSTERPQDQKALPSIPRLPFTRVAPLIVNRSHILAGFGNSVGLFILLSQ